MRIGLTGCTNQCSGFMASRALGGRSFKYAAIVATFAIDSHMRAGKRKSGAKMIEIGARGRTCRAAERNQKQADDSR